MLRTALLGGLLAVIGPAAHAQTIVATEYASGLTSPVVVTHAGDGSDRLFVVEQRGFIRVIDADGALQTAPFLDIDALVSSGGERGLLGLAFHPDYATNGLFYVDYTGPVGFGTGTIIEEYAVSADNPNAADPDSRRTILTFSQPFGNHNGGWIGFGPDGYLYIATGDGGSGNDPQNNASRTVNLLGKMLRIDVDSTDNGLQYAIPAGNPFADDPASRDEIWHYGLRNPWRCSFDRETGDLWMGDVGQGAREEVNRQLAGSAGGNHYGWRCREGFIATPGISCTNNPDWVDPVYDYGAGCSVIGGYVYRGCQLGDSFKGKYFFSDFCNGDIWTLDPDNGFARTTVLSANFGVSCYGEDEDGELYLGDLSSGSVFKIGLQDPIGTCGPCSDADFAEPYGALNFFDISAYITAFNAGDDVADLAAPFGALNFFDISAYITLFNAGCP